MKIFVSFYNHIQFNPPIFSESQRTILPIFHTIVGEGACLCQKLTEAFPDFRD